MTRKRHPETKSKNLKRLSNQINKYLNGQSADFKDFKVIESGTKFQNLVWRALRSIPKGEVRTYGDVAKAIGKPKAVRAVGSACGKNPWLILTPCHRVIGGSNLGGFSCGLKIKTKLLALEAK